MEELKTLKDLVHTGDIKIPKIHKRLGDADYSMNVDYSEIKDLRAEAIKWVKELKRLMKIKTRPLHTVDTSTRPMSIIHKKFPTWVYDKKTGKIKSKESNRQDVALMYISILAHIFNITDEDLK